MKLKENMSFADYRDVFSKQADVSILAPNCADLYGGGMPAITAPLGDLARSTPRRRTSEYPRFRGVWQVVRDPAPERTFLVLTVEREERVGVTATRHFCFNLFHEEEGLAAVLERTGDLWLLDSQSDAAILLRDLDCRVVREWRQALAAAQGEREAARIRTWRQGLKRGA